MHGVEVRDPYRWLENGESAETSQWVAGQNGRTRALLDALPERPLLRRRLEALLRVTVVGAPRLASDRLFALERGGDREQAVLTVRSALDPAVAARTLVDPVAGGGDTTAAIDWYHPSHDGRLLAYGTSEAGDERSTLRVLDVDTGEHLGDVIPHCRAASWRGSRTTAPSPTPGTRRTPSTTGPSGGTGWAPTRPGTSWCGGPTTCPTRRPGPTPP